MAMLIAVKLLHQQKLVRQINTIQLQYDKQSTKCSKDKQY